MMLLRRFMVILALPLAVMTCWAGENDAEAVKKALQKTIDAGVEVLDDDSLDDDARLARFDTILSEACHLGLMAKLALGKTGWSAFDDTQRSAFVTSFRDLIKRSYYGKVAHQDMDSFVVEYTANDEIGKGKRSLTAVMKTNSSQIEVIYKFFLRDGNWRIYDVEVEGVSLIVSYRSQFNDFLVNHTAGELLDELKRSESSFLPEEKPSSAKKAN